MAKDTKEKELDPNAEAKLKDAYGSKKEWEYAQNLIQQIDEDLELREKQTMISNGLSYSDAYKYNQRKAINYAPPRNPKDDREVSMGIVHEKIVSFAAIFLKYVFKRRIKCYDNNQNLIKGLGEIYDLGIEFSHKLEEFKKKIALIYWEVFTQGNAFVLEDWEVKTKKNPKAYKKGEGEDVLVTAENMDYTYEFLDNLKYEDGEEVQVRRAVSRVLDGRSVIFGDPEIEEVQEQPRITLEREISAKTAEELYSSLKRWTKVPKTHDSIMTMLGKEKSTIFDSTRHKKPSDVFLEHRCWDKENNRFNIFLNGVMLLPRKTPMTIFYPRGNYPLTNVPAERLRGSIYARSIPAKTKFNADFVDWALKMLADKFEQGIDPAVLTNGKFTLTRDMFRGGKVTHGIKREDYEFANEEALKGVTNAEFNFVTMLKDIIESQTVNPTTAGELSSSATATEISVVENNQRDKLGYLLDGLMLGFMDMAMRRAETIESKYTVKQKETLVDGKKINVYQNFTVNVSGIENVVVFDDSVGKEGYDEDGKRNELFKKAFDEKKGGSPTEFYLVNPDMIRTNQYILMIEIHPERVKDSQLQMIQLWDEFTQLLNTFGQDVSMEEMKKMYLETSGRSDELFTKDIYQRLEREVEAEAAYNTGSFGKGQKPTVKGALKDQAGVK